MPADLSLTGQIAAVARALDVQQRIASGGTVRAAGRLEPEQYQIEALQAVSATLVWLVLHGELLKAYRAQLAQAEKERAP